MKLVHAKKNLEKQLTQYGLNPMDWQVRWPEEERYLWTHQEKILNDVVIRNKEDASFCLHAQAQVKNQGAVLEANWLEIRVAGL